MGNRVLIDTPCCLLSNVSFCFRRVDVDVDSGYCTLGNMAVNQARLISMARSSDHESALSN